MINVFVGVEGEPDSVLMFEFETVKEAMVFGDTIAEHYMEERKKLYLYIDCESAYNSMDLVYKANAKCDIEINPKEFERIRKECQNEG